MRYGSVCSGIEAASAAWRPLGWKAQWFAEIEAFPSAVLKHHYPTVHNYGDFTQIPADAPPIDVLVGGTPCQSFSVAGLRGGLDDERGNLALEFCRLADRLRPRWIVWENVPGVLSSNGGRDFGSILGAMGELGYGTAYRVLDAQYAGVPQRRRRVFVVGYLGDWRRAAAVLFERHSLSGHPPPRREKGKGFTHELAPCIGASGRGFERGGDPRGQDPVVAVCPTLEGGNNRTGGTRPPGTTVDTADSLIAISVGYTIHGTDGTVSVASETEIAGSLRTKPPGSIENSSVVLQPSTGEISHCLNAGGMGRIDYETETLISVAGTLKSNGDGGGLGSDPSETFIPVVTHSIRADGFDASEDGTGRGTPLPAVAFDCKASGRNGFGVGDMAPTLRAMGHKNTHSNAGGQIAVSLAIRGRDGVPQIEMGDEVANAILTPNGGRGGIGVGAMMRGPAVRRLTPLECERLQGFPDGYTAVPYRGKPAADGPRYKALGNSMAVPVMAWIGQRIQAADNL